MTDDTKKSSFQFTDVPDTNKVTFVGTKVPGSVPVKQIMLVYSKWGGKKGAWQLKPKEQLVLVVQPLTGRFPDPNIFWGGKQVLGI